MSIRHDEVLVSLIKEPLSVARFQEGLPQEFLVYQEGPAAHLEECPPEVLQGLP